MEGGGGALSTEEEKQEAGSSYTYWVRELRKDAAPLPVPRKLTSQDLLISSQSQTSSTTTTLGSIWNSAGTWEEKNLNKWATNRIKELLASAGSLEFSSGKAEISEVSKCMGDAFLVTVRNKKRVGYTFELTLKVKGEWTFREEKKMVKGHIDILEFSFGELDDLQVHPIFALDGFQMLYGESDGKLIIWTPYFLAQTVTSLHLQYNRSSVPLACKVNYNEN